MNRNSEIEASEAGGSVLLLLRTLQHNGADGHAVALGALSALRVFVMHNVGVERFADEIKELAKFLVGEKPAPAEKATNRKARSSPWGDTCPLLKIARHYRIDYDFTLALADAFLHNAPIKDQTWKTYILHPHMEAITIAVTSHVDRFRDLQAGDEP